MTGIFVPHFQQCTFLPIIYNGGETFNLLFLFFDLVERLWSSAERLARLDAPIGSHFSYFDS